LGHQSHSGRWHKGFTIGRSDSKWHFHTKPKYLHWEILYCTNLQSDLIISGYVIISKTTGVARHMR